MVLSTMSFSAFAEDTTVATVNEVPYTSLADALEAASAVDGAVTVELTADVKWETGAEHGSTPFVPEESEAIVTINGNDYTITATGAGVGPIRAANGTLLTFNNVNFVDESVSYAEDSWEFTYLEFAGKFKFTDCDFKDEISVDSEAAEFVGCTFESNEENVYAVWVSNGSVSFTENCYFTGYRGIKMHEAYGSEITAVTVEGCKFENITKKPGIAIGDLNADTQVAVENCEFVNVQAGDQGSYVFESDTDVSAFTFESEENKIVNGTITPGYATVPKVPGSTRIWGEGTANANESFVVELYAGDEKIAQASLNDYEDIIDGDVSVTWGIPYDGKDSEYWDVEWYDNNPVVDKVPTKVVLYADGVKVAENEVRMNSADDLNPIKWNEIEAVKAVARIGKAGYGSLEAAAAAAEASAAGDTEIVIDILEDMTLDTGIQFHNSKNITINGNDHTITLVHNTDDNNYSNPHEEDERPTGFSISDDKYYSEEPGSVFNIKNMTLVNNKGLGYYKSGHSWRASYHTYAYAETANYTNVNFVGGVSVAQDASFVNCTFTEDREDMFMVFADQEYSGAEESYEISFDGCEFNYAGNAYGTIKIANDEGAFSVEVKNSTFNNCANKPAINADTNITATIKNNLFNNCVAGAFNADSGTVNGVDVTSEEATAAINDVNTVIVNEITVGFAEVEPGLYNIVLTAADDIYEFVGAELTFANTSKTVANEDMNYEILGVDGVTNVEKSIEKANTYALRLVDGAERMSGKDLVIGQVKFYGQGDINFTVSEGKVVATEYGTNLGKYYTVDADDTTDDTLVVEAITNGAVKEVTRTVVVNVAYKHALDGKYWKDAAGNAANQITVTLKDGFGNVYDAEDLTNGVATINNVKLGRLTVTLEAPGFRKYVYNTTLEAGADETDALVLNFWNDIKRDTVQSPLAEIEAGVSGKTNKNFVVGDIVMDYTVDEYDLAAVTSYYGMYELTDADKYIKYDLNRDGNIDIIDVHYVLHTLGN